MCFLSLTANGPKVAKPGVTACPLSPLLRFADDSFILSVQSLSFASSYVAPVALIDSLTAALGSLKGNQLIPRLKEAGEEQRHGYRWYPVES
jgi:DNA-binding MurR/RpiR family transcriptional regulator